MKFKVHSALEYYAYTASTLVLNIHVLRTPNQTVIEESFGIEPYFKSEELVSTFGENRFVRIEIPDQTKININYTATIDNAFTLIDHSNHQQVPVAQLDTAVFPYLYPSRYCQSDKLYRFANNKFGKIENPFAQVLTLTNWINRNIEYLSGSTNAQTSAYDTVTEHAGVCRDFAHLGIALCRALTIPARYFTGYAFSLKPPDFHACFEAYIGGQWILFDATKLAPLNGIVKIATGRDAADTAVASLFGNIVCNSIEVNCEKLEETFEPFYYIPNGISGFCYL